MNTTAIVIGATGLTGRELVAQLSTDSEYHAIIAVVRKPYDFKCERVSTLTVDFDSWVDNPSLLAGRLAPLIAPKSRIDAFCCLGTTIKVAKSKDAFRHVDFEYPVAFARALRELGATHLGVVSALGANAESRVFYSRVKGEMENAIIGISLPSIHFVRPSFLEGDRAENRLGEKLGIAAAKLVSPLLIGPLRRYRAVSVVRVAQALRDQAARGGNGVHVSESETL